VTVTIHIDNRIRMKAAELGVDCVNALKQEFTHKNPKRESMQYMKIPGFWNEPKFYATFKRDNDAQGVEWYSFPRGGMARIRAVLEEFELEWEEIDERNEGAPDVRREDIPDHRLTPYEHQLEAVDAAMQREQCLIQAPTGSGKTVVVFNLISRWKVPSLIVVPTAALMRQWEKRIPIELGIKDYGFIRGKHTKLRPVTLTMPATLAKRLEQEGAQEIRDYFGAVFGDEAQLFAADTFYRSIDPMPARYRIAVSADEKRKDKKEFLIYDLFGDVAKKITRKRLVKQGVILDVEIWVIPTEFRADWYGLSQENEEGESDEEGTEKKKLDFDRLLNEMLRNDERNRLVYETIKRTVDGGKQILALAHRREHCWTIDRTLASYAMRIGALIGGADNKRIFEETFAKLESGDLDVGVGTYQATGTGLDLPRIAVGIGVTPIAGNKQFFNQVRGRFCRTVKDGSIEKKDAKLYYLWDKHVYPSHLKNLMKWNSKVVVWTGTSWIDARHYLEEET